MRLRVIVAGIPAFLSLSVLVLPGSVSAEDVMVSGDCTYDDLVSAIGVASTTSGPAGVVTFDCEDEIIEFNGVNDIKIESHVVIDGTNGGNQIALTNDLSEGLLSVEPLGSLTVKHLALIGGGEVYGGAIYSQGTVVVDDCFFLGNTAQSGGAILSTEGSLTVRNSRFNFNIANREGGAIEV